MAICIDLRQLCVRIQTKVEQEPKVPFVLARDRDAWGTIHGFVVQVDLTILRWLNLKVGYALELERGEDIDEVARELHDGRSVRTIEQVKSRESSISLRSASALEAVANFAEHRELNRTSILHFRFTTNARRALERPHILSGALRGIDAWEELSKAEFSGAIVANLSVLRSFLSNANRPAQLNESTWAALARFLATSDDESFHTFVRNSSGAQVKQSMHR